MTKIAAMSLPALLLFSGCAPKPSAAVCPKLRPVYVAKTSFSYEHNKTHVWTTVGNFRHIVRHANRLRRAVTALNREIELYNENYAKGGR